MTTHIMYDWDSATVKVTVPVHHTATVERQEIELPLAAFAELLCGVLETEDGKALIAPPGSALPFATEVPDPMPS